MAITEFMAIVPSFVISLSIFMNVPTEFFTSVILIFPLFLAFPDAKFTLFATVASSISAIPTELSAVSVPPGAGFFLRFISALLSFNMSIPAAIVVAPSFIP